MPPHGAEGANPPRNLSGKRTVRAGSSGAGNARPVTRPGGRQRGRASIRPHRLGSPTMTHLDSPFAARHIGPSPDDVARMLDDRRLRLGRRADGRGDPRIDPLPRPPGAARRRDRSRSRSPSCARSPARNKPLVSMIGLGYYGTHTPPVIRRNVLERPVLVHRVHAVPAGDQPGPARGAAQLPDRGHGPDRSRHGERVDARRGHGRGRGDDARAAIDASRQANVYVVDADTLPQTIGVITTRAIPLGIEVRVVDLANDELPAELLRPAPAVPGRLRRDPRSRARSSRPPTPPAPWSRSPPTCSP